MFEVGDGGEVCYTYADCLALIREGKDIDYEGITGPGTYTDGGVNAVNSSYTPFNEDGTVGEAVLLDPAKALELVDADQDRGDVRPGGSAQPVRVVASGLPA